jgi:hypothetical protein
MGIAKSFAQMPAKLVILLWAVSVALSSWALAHFGGSQLLPWLTEKAVQYDKVFPEVTFRDGQARVNVEQPHYVRFADPGSLVVVFDTNVSGSEAAIKYLEKSENGLALVRDTVVVKNESKIRITELKEVPDLVINSASLSNFLTTKWKALFKIAVILVVIYSTIAKLLQILLLAFVPVGALRFASVSITYREGVRLAAAGLFGASLFEFISGAAGALMPVSLWVYFAFFFTALAILIFDYVRDTGDSPYAADV